MDKSHICPPALRIELQNLATIKGLPLQSDALSEADSGAGGITRAAGGVPSAVFGIPARYRHTAHELCAPADAETAAEILHEFLQSRIS